MNNHTMTAKQAADFLGYSAANIYMLEKSKTAKFPRRLKGKDTAQFSAKAVKRWAESNLERSSKTKPALAQTAKVAVLRENKTTKHAITVPYAEVMPFLTQISETLNIPVPAVLEMIGVSRSNMSRWIRKDNVRKAFLYSLKGLLAEINQTGGVAGVASLTDAERFTIVQALGHYTKAHPAKQAVCVTIMQKITA